MRLEYMITLIDAIAIIIITLLILAFLSIILGICVFYAIEPLCEKADRSVTMKKLLIKWHILDEEEW